MGGDRTRELSRHPAGRHPADTLVTVTPLPTTKGTSMSIRKLHSKGCPGRDGGRCKCGAGWEAAVFSKRDDKKIRKTFSSRAEAKTWRDDANAQLAKGGLRAPKPTTIREAWEEWYAGAKEGTIRNRSGDRYKPAAIRNYEEGMRLRCSLNSAQSVSPISIAWSYSDSSTDSWRTVSRPPRSG